MGTGHEVESAASESEIKPPATKPVGELTSIVPFEHVDVKAVIRVAYRRRDRGVSA
jgi:hypothetical protein